MLYYLQNSCWNKFKLHFKGGFSVQSFKQIFFNCAVWFGVPEIENINIKQLQ